MTRRRVKHRERSQDSQATGGRKDQATLVEVDSESFTKANGAGRSPRSTFRKCLAAGTLVLFLGVILAPSMVIRPSLLNYIVRWAVPDLPGQLTIGSSSAGWIRSIKLQDVRLLDADRNSVVNVAEITTAKSLLGLLISPRSVGRIEINRPNVQLELYPNGSNLEEMLLAIAADSQDAAQEPGGTVSFHAAINDGTIEIQSGADRWTVDNLNAELITSSELPRTMNLTVNTNVQTSQSTGELHARLIWNRPMSSVAGDLGSGKARLNCSKLPLSLLGTVAKRWRPSLQMAGHAHSDLDCTWDWTDDSPNFSTDGYVSLVGLTMSDEPLLATDEPHIESANVEFNVLLDKNILHVSNLAMDSDLCRVAATGSMEIDLTRKEGVASFVPRPLGDRGYRIKADIDVARLASALPATFRMRKDARPTSGKIAIDFIGRHDPSGPVWDGTVKTGQIVGVKGQRPIQWDQPLQLAFKIQDSTNGLLIDKLRCTAPFIQVAAEDRAGNGSLTASGDLGQLMHELGEFVDLGSAKLGGRLQVTGRWQRNDDGHVNARGQMVLGQFHMATESARPWTEEQLVLEVTADGTFDNRASIALNTATLRLDSSNDQLHVSLAQPVTVSRRTPQLPIEFQLQGNVDTWLTRIQPWCSLSDWQTRGSIHAGGMATAGTELVEFEQARVELKELIVRGSGITIREPTVRLETSGTWNHTTQELVSNETTLSSASVALRATGFRLSLNDWQGQGEIGLRADLSKLSQWFLEPRETSGYYSTGSVLGRVNLTQQQGSTAIAGTIEVEPFELFSAVPAEQLRSGQPRWQPLWREARMTLKGTGRYESKSDQLELEQLEIVSDGIRVRTQGQITSPLAEMNADLKGHADFDMRQVSEKLRPLLGEGIQIDGKRSRPFLVQGPLARLIRGETVRSGGRPATRYASSQVNSADTDLRAEASLGWDSANIYGLPVGPNDFTVRLGQGVATSTPWNLQVSEGRVTISPLLTLTGRRPEFILDRGTSIEGLRITPEMCGTWLKYVAPLMADATQAEGSFSLGLDEARFPIDNPQQATVSGALAIHSAQLVPGPLAKQFMSIAQQVTALVDRGTAASRYLDSQRAWMEVGNQQIDFHMKDGRVHHRNLEVQVGDVTVRTEGWVATDQSLSLLAQVPIRDEWIQQEPFLAGLRGQSIRIPISGTLTQPRMDNSAITQLTGQLLGGAAQGFLQNELQNQLQKLFKSK